MKALTVVMAATAIVILMAGCNGNYQHEEQADMNAPASVVSSSAAVESLKDSARKFIRTSDMKFRVKDVAKATYQIEDITRSFNGFVTYTHLESNTEDKK